MWGFIIALLIGLLPLILLIVAIVRSNKSENMKNKPVTNTNLLTNMHSKQ